MRRKPPRYDTKARRALAVQLADFGAQSALAAKLEVYQAGISRWLKGDARPEPHLRDAIEILYPGIPAIDWRTDEEILFLERIRDLARAA